MSRIDHRLITLLMVALFFAIALFLRVYLPYDRVFTEVGIKFTSSDAYYHMRLVDSLVTNFPNFTSVDPFFIFPGATGEISIRFFGWLIAVPAWIIGLGSPTQQTINTVGAYLPAILGALTVIPVYFIGKELFGRWAGLLSAGLIVIIPGEFIGRSIIGFTDYHIAEALFTTTTMMFLIFAVKAAYRQNITFSHIMKLDWPTLKRPLVYSLMAGLFMGIYIFTWAGALLFVFIIFTYFVVQFITDHLKRKSTESLVIVCGTFFLVVLIISLLVSVSRLYLVTLLIALLVPIALSAVSSYMVKKEMRPAYYLLAISGLGAAAMGILYLITPLVLSVMINAFSIFNPTGAQLTTIEMQPLISQMYGNPFVIVWSNFSTGFFISFVSLGILIYRIIVEESPGKILLVVWSLVILAAVLGQRRFGYYYAVNVALLTGYLSWRVLEMAGFREQAEKAVRGIKSVGTRVAGSLKGESRVIARFNMTLAVIVVFFVAFFWNINPAITVAGSAPYAPSNAWVNSLKWMKENTPEPMGNSEAYYGLYERTEGERYYQYPESAYGVLAWWDYGYWISRIAHRIPNANPGQNPKANSTVAAFFTSQEEETANEIAEELGSKYVILDYESAYINPRNAAGKFSAIIIWAGKEPAEYYDVYLLPQENQMLTQVILYSPEYYRSVAVRLYNFDGQAVTPEITTVISYQRREDAEGNPFKIIDSAEQFDTYQEAVDYIAGQDSDNFKIVSANPMVSPVPLEAMTNYSFIHSSDELIALPDFGPSPQVKIFEYLE